MPILTYSILQLVWDSGGFLGPEPLRGRERKASNADPENPSVEGEHTECQDASWNVEKCPLADGSARTECGPDS